LIDFFRVRAAHAAVHRGRLINLRSRLHVHSMRAANRNVRLDYGANSWRMPSFASSTALNTSSRVRKLAPQKLIASVNTRFTSVRVSCFVFDIQPRVPSSSRFVKRKSWGADGIRLFGAGISKPDVPSGCSYRLPIASHSRDFAHQPVVSKNVVDYHDVDLTKLRALLANLEREGLRYLHRRGWTLMLFLCNQLLQARILPQRIPARIDA